MSSDGERHPLVVETIALLSEGLTFYEEKRGELLARLDRIIISDEDGVGAANAYAAEISKFLEGVGHEEAKATRIIDDAKAAAAATTAGFVADIFVARAQAFDRIGSFREECRIRAEAAATEQHEEEERRRAAIRKPTMSEQPGTAVALLDKPRLAMPAVIAEKYGVDEEGWRVLVDAVFPLAKTTEGVMMALSYCHQRKLDIFRKCVHLVPMKVKMKDGTEKEIETVWPGIGELRITAQRQSDFFGYDECEFGPDVAFQGTAKIQKWEGNRRNGWEEVKWDGMVPEWAQFTVYKLIHGQRVALKGPKVYFIETYSPVSRWNPAPNERWTRAPRQMLEKSSEAAALRRAWPDVFGDEASFEEMEGKTIFAGTTIGGNDATPDHVADAGKTIEEADDRVTDAEFTEVEDVEETVAEEASNPAPVATETAETSSDERPSIPTSRAQWEVYQDNILDKLEDRKTVETVASLLGNNSDKLAAAPDDIRETIETAFQARLAKLSGGAPAGPGAGESDQSTPEE